MLAVSSLPLFVLCPRAFYFKETLPAIGKKKQTASRTQRNTHSTIKQIIPPTSSRMLESEWIGLRGQCKFIQDMGIRYPTVFRNSAMIKPNAEDILKLSCYSILLENCPEGRVVNPSTGAVFQVKVNENMRDGVMTILEGAKNVLVSDYPPAGKKGENCPRCVYRQPCKAYIDSPPEMQEDGWIIPENENSSGPGANTLPLYLQEQGAKIGITGETFVITKNGKALKTVLMTDVSQIVIYGNIQITSQAIRKAFEKGIQVLFYSSRGTFSGMARGLACYNSKIKPAQFCSIANTDIASHISQALIEAKISNCRAFLMRNSEHSEAAKSMKTIQNKIHNALSQETLRGFEGSAARLYFSGFSSMLKSRAIADGFCFSRRNRRPPKDPVNSLLSFGYSLLVREFAVAIEAVGLDPMHGFYHASRSMRPALALDLMEPFRPVIADSLAISLLNKGILGMDDFTIKEDGSCYMSREARKTYISQYENRLNTKVNYNGCGTISYRNAIRKSVQDLKAFLLKTQPEYEPLRVK
jgi:CRISPR-associated protein Cas1